MTAANESLIFNGTELNALTGSPYALAEFNPGIAKLRPEWATGADADGAVLVRGDETKYDNAQITGKLAILDPSRDTANNLIGAFIDLCQEARKNAGGIPIVWTPANSTKSLTGYVLAGEIQELPIDVEAILGGLWQPTFVLDRKPFWYGAENGNVTDNFATNSIANYSFDAGSGTLSISGGQLVPSSTAAKRLYLSSGNYTSWYDVQVGLKFTTGAAVAAQSTAVTFKRLDASNNLFVQVGGGAGGSLDIFKRDGGSATNLATVANSTATGTSYWVRARIEGNVIYAELWTSAPTPTGTPAKTLSYTLAGADAAKFGQGVQGGVGIEVTPAGTDYRYDDFTIEPNLWVSTNPLLIGTLPGVPGDVAAEGRLITTERSGQSRRYWEFGIQSRFTNLANSLLLDDGVLVTTNFAGTSGALAGAYGGTAITATLTTNPVAVCGLGNLANVGQFRIRVRCKPSTATQYVRLTWKEGDGPLRSNSYAIPPQSATFVDLDLGIINIPQAQLGTQRWTGQIEAYDYAGAGSTLAVDHVVLIPCGEGYGKVRAEQRFESPTVFSARDEFGQTAGALGGKTAAQGGSWTAKGGATGANDLQVETTGHTVQTSYNGAAETLDVLGSSMTAQLVQVDLKHVNASYGGVLARTVDGINYLRARLLSSPNAGTSTVRVETNIAASTTTLRLVTLPQPTTGAWWTVRLVVDASGRFWAWVFPQGTPAGDPLVSGVASALATGGVLATGQGGIYDGNLVATQRNYDNFFVAAPTDYEVLFAGRQLEIRSDGVQRQDSTGTYYGPPPSAPRGSHFFLPPAGSAGRTTRVAVKADRNNIEAQEDVPIGDSLQAQVIYTPRYLAVPR